MKIKLTKKLTKSEKKEYIFRNSSYDWEDNYIKLIKTYIDANFSYDKDNRRNLIDNEIINDITFDDIYQMFIRSNLGICNQNNIKSAITKICKENEFSIKEQEKQKKKELKEQDIKEIPDKLFKYIELTYGNDLSYNISNRKTYYKDKSISKYDMNNICLNIQSNIMFKNINKTNIEAVIYEVAKLKKFEEKLSIDETIDDCWNILSEVDSNSWQDYIQVDSKNRPIHSTFNYALFLSFHPQFRNKLSYNLFDKIESLQIFDKDYGCVVDKPIDDDLIHLIEAQIERYFNDFNTKYVDRALSVVFHNNSFHEIKRIFKSIENKGWDRKPRMHEIMIKYFGCKDCKEIREMTEVMLCGSVQRILEEKPNEGTMFDYMGIMFGKQGSGKTKFMTRLYLGDRYTTINPRVDDDQIFTDLSNRAWLVLFDELKGIDKADMPTVKSRITEQGANVRLSYGRRSKYFPRHIAFWGNTNYRGVLRDEGYERRFLCFECNSNGHNADWWIKNYTDYDIEQIWAETLEIYHEKWEGKVIQISKETEDWNYMIQIHHKVWVEDSRTDIELKEILNYKHYNYPLFEPDKFRIWMKILDELKLSNTSNHGQNELKFINTKWILYRISRKQEWIDGMIENYGWKKIHVKDDIFGDEDYYIKNNLTFEDIKNEWLEYSNIDVEDKKLPF